MKYFRPCCFIIAIGFVFPGGMIKKAVAYDVNPVENGGDLIGTIYFKGETPVKPPLTVDRNSNFCGKTVPDESLIINAENKGIQNVVISLDNISHGKQHDPATIVLDNSKCRFVPHTLAAMVGDSYELKNSDPILHNTHLRFEGGSTFLNIVLPANVKTIKRPITQAGIIDGNCDAHHFMTVNMLVFNHPYFAVTDPKGEFKIFDIPPGKYKVKIWHESIPGQEREIIIRPREKTDLSLQLSLKK